MSLSGLAITFFNKKSVDYNPQYFIGMLCALAAVLSWIFGSFKMSSPQQPFSIFYSFGWQLVMSSIVLFVISVIAGDPLPDFSSMHFQTIAAFVYLSLLGSVAAFMIYGYLINKHLLSKISLYEYLSPVVATVLGIIVFNEPYNGPIIGGIGLAIGGVILLRRS